jgi:hypothetical protein
VSNADGDQLLRVAIVAAPSGGSESVGRIGDTTRAIAATLFGRGQMVLNVPPTEADVLVLVGAASGGWGDEVVRTAEAFAARVGPERIVIVVDGAPAATASIAQIAGDAVAAVFPTEPLWIDLRAAQDGAVTAIIRALDEERRRRRPTSPAPAVDETIAGPGSSESEPGVAPFPAATAPTADAASGRRDVGRPHEYNKRIETCSNCGTRNLPGRTYCETCGTVLVAAAQAAAAGTSNPSFGAPSAPMPAGSAPLPRAGRASRWLLVVAVGFVLALLLASLLISSAGEGSGTGDSGSGEIPGWVFVVVIGGALLVAASFIAYRFGRRSSSATGGGQGPAHGSRAPRLDSQQWAVPEPPAPPPDPPFDSPVLTDGRAVAFVSYATEDEQSVVRELVDWLRSVVEVWFAPEEIRIGQQWLFAISDALETADFFVVVITKRSMSSPWVRQELSAAFRRSVESGIPHLVPVLAEPCDYPILLGNFQMIDATVLSRQQTRDQLVAVVH